MKKVWFAPDKKVEREAVTHCPHHLKLVEQLVVFIKVGLIMVWWEASPALNLFMIPPTQRHADNHVCAHICGRACGVQTNH